MTNEIKGRIVRQDGSVVNSFETLREILYLNKDLAGCLIDDADEVKRFQLANKLCDTKLAEPTYSKDSSYTNITWRDYWFTPDPYSILDVKEWCLAKCTTHVERDRVLQEIDEFEKRNMIPAIRHMIYCVDIWRNNNIVWGVGRGSSVSSYVLYLIGITRLNPLQYNLELAEWLK